MYVLTMTNLYGGGGGVLYLNTSPSYPTFGKYINGSNIEIKQLVKTFFSRMEPKLNTTKQRYQHLYK